VFDRLSLGYGAMTRRLVRVSVLVLVVYAGLIALTGWQFTRAPTGFIPDQDQGYLITVIQLPPGASLPRTDAVVRRAAEIALATEGVVHAVPFAGFDGATFTNAPNAGAIFVTLAPFEERAAQGLSAQRILGDLIQRYGSIQEAFIIVIQPPPVRGIGTGGGFKMMVQDRRGRGLEALEETTRELPWRRMIWLVRAKPMPRPGNSEGLCNRWKTPNSRVACFGLNPTPLSRIWKSPHPSVSDFQPISIFATSLGAVNLIELANRCPKACLICVRSAKTTGREAISHSIFRCVQDSLRLDRQLAANPRISMPSGRRSARPTRENSSKSSI
jgi:hypothetical protein